MDGGYDACSYWFDLLLFFGHLAIVWTSKFNIMRTLGMMSVGYWFDFLLSSGHFNFVWASTANVTWACFILARLLTVLLSFQPRLDAKTQRQMYGRYDSRGVLA